MGANDDVYKRTNLVPRVALHFKIMNYFFQHFPFFLVYAFCAITSSFPTQYSLSIISIVPLQLCLAVVYCTVALFLSSYHLHSYIRTFQRMSFVRAVHLRVPSGGEFFAGFIFFIVVLVWCSMSSSSSSSSNNNNLI